MADATGIFKTATAAKIDRSGDINYSIVDSLYCGVADRGTVRTTYRMYCYPGEGDSFLEDNIADCQHLRIKVQIHHVELRSISLFFATYDELHTNMLYVPNGLFSIIESSAVDKVEVDIDDTAESTEFVFETEDTEVAQRILRYGFGFFSENYGVVEVQSISLETFSASPKAPPVIGFDRSLMTNGYFREDGTYVHMPDKPFTIGFTYFQEAGIEMAFMSVELIPDGETDSGYSEGVSSGNIYEISIEKWNFFPQAGRIGIKAISSKNVYSDVVYLNYEVAHRDVSIVSHSDFDLVKSNAEVIISWEAALPERFQDAPVPSEYRLAYWYDDALWGETVSLTETSYTIIPENVGSGKILHFALEDKYIVADEGVVSRTDYADTLSLYVQQAASADNVRILAGQVITGGDIPVVPALVWIEWDTSGQTAYQVRVGNHLSPVLFGSASSYVVPEVLPDGVVDASIRVQDAYGKWSDWTAPVYARVNNGRFLEFANWGEDETAHTVTAVSDDSGAVAITVHTDALVGGWDLLIYRDDVLIAVADSAAQDIVYTDRAACGVCEYRVIAVHHASHNYYMGPYSAVVETYPATDTLVLDDGGAVAFPFVSERPEGYSVSTSRDAHLVHYAGRTDPVLIDSGRRTRTLPLMYMDVGHDLGRRMEGLDGRTVWFKNVLGMRMRGAIGGLSVVYGYRRCVVSFTLTQVDHDEAVPYIWRG